MESPLRPRVYTRFFSIRFKPEDVLALEKIAASKGYVSACKFSKSKRSNITRLIREIVEDYIKDGKGY